MKKNNFLLLLIILIVMSCKTTMTIKTIPVQLYNDVVDDYTKKNPCIFKTDSIKTKTDTIIKIGIDSNLLITQSELLNIINELINTIDTIKKDTIILKDTLKMKIFKLKNISSNIDVNNKKEIIHNNEYHYMSNDNLKEKFNILDLNNQNLNKEIKYKNIIIILLVIIIIILLYLYLMKIFKNENSKNS